MLQDILGRQQAGTTAALQRGLEQCHCSTCHRAGTVLHQDPALQPNRQQHQRLCMYGNLNQCRWILLRLFLLFALRNPLALPLIFISAMRNAFKTAASGRCYFGCCGRRWVELQPPPKSVRIFHLDTGFRFEFGGGPGGKLSTQQAPSGACATRRRVMMTQWALGTGHWALPSAQWALRRLRTRMPARDGLPWHFQSFT